MQQGGDLISELERRLSQTAAPPSPAPAAAPPSNLVAELERRLSRPEATSPLPRSPQAASPPRGTTPITPAKPVDIPFVNRPRTAAPPAFGKPVTEWIDPNPAPIYDPVAASKQIGQGAAKAIFGVEPAALQQSGWAARTMMPKEPGDVRMAGASDVIEGAMTLGSPLLIPALAANPVATITALAKMTAAAELVHYFGERFGANHEFTRLAANITGFAAAGVGGGTGKAFREGLGERPALPITPRAIAPTTPVLTVGQKIAEADARAKATIDALEARIQEPPQAPTSGRPVTTPSSSADVPVATPRPEPPAGGPVPDVVAALESRLADAPKPEVPRSPRDLAEAAIKAHIDSPVPKTFAELPALERREFRRILEEMDEQRYDRGGPMRTQRLTGEERDFLEKDWTPRQANAPVFHAVKGDKSRTAKAIRASMEKWMAGTGRLTPIIEDAARRGRERAYIDERAYGSTLPPEQGAGSAPGELPVKPRRWGQPDQAKERELIAAVERDPQGHLDRYRAQYGNRYNADDMSEIVGVHGAKRWEHHDAARGPAGTLVQAGFDSALAREVTSADDVVLFSAGGTGSGKSTTFKNITRDQIALDSTLANYEQSKGNLETALRSNRGAVVEFTYRDPVEAYRNGVLKRKLDPTNGRDVPIGTHANTHINAPKTFLRLVDEFAPEKRPFDEPPVVFRVVDNSGPEPVLRDVEWLRTQTERYTDVDAIRHAITATDTPAEAGPGAGGASGGRARGAVAEEPLRSGGRSGTQAEPAPEVTRPGQPPITRQAPAGQTAGSPTRAMYQPGATPITPTKGGRPVSEQQTVNRLREIFAVTRATPTYLKRLFGEAQAAYPMRTKKLPRAFGDYNTQTGLIRLRRAFDLTTTSHELGHMISDRIFGATGPRGLFRAELAQLGKATTPKSKQSAAGSPYQIEEGVAEYFRTWFADEAQARQHAPQFTQALEAWFKTNPAAELQLTAAQAAVQRYLSQPEAVRGRARVNVQTTGVVGRVKDVVGEMRASSGGFVSRFKQALKDTGNVPELAKDPVKWFDNLAHHWIDRHTAIKRAVVDMGKRGGPPKTIEQNAYALTRLADGASGMAEGFLKVGARGRDGKFLGASLKSALQPIRHKLYPTADRTGPDFATYLVAKRALELHSDGKGRWPGLTAEEAKTIIRETHADVDGAKFQAAADNVYSYLRGLRQYAEHYGMFSKELMAKLDESMFYVPMQRVMDAAADQLQGRAAIVNRGLPIKRLKGSGRDIIDPIESIVKNTEAIVNAVEKNRAAAALVQQAKATPHSADWLIEIPAKKLPSTFNLQQLSKDIISALDAAGIDLPTNLRMSGDKTFDQVVTAFVPAAFGDPKLRIVTVMEKGERKFYQVQDEALYQNITQMGLTPTSEVLKWAAKPTAVLRAGATLRPSFIVRNLLRDTVGAMLQSRHGFVPVWDSMRGMISQLKNDEAFRQFQAFGVQSSSLLGQDRVRMKSFIDDLSRPSGLKANMRLAVHPIEALRRMSEQIEVATRLGEFKLALESGGKERRAGVLGIGQRIGDFAAGRSGKTPITESSLTTAALAARDVTVDFAKGGRTAKEISQFKAFFNARLQGYVRIGETVHRDPVGAALTVGTLAALGAALWTLNKDDEEYQELSAQQKRDYWHIKLPGNDWFLTIPKPFEWAMVPNLVEAALDEHVDTADVMSVASASDFVMQAMPTATLPLLEAFFNKSTFTKRPIVNPWDEKKPADLQVRDSTSDLARVVASPLGVSPAKLEHVAYGYGGGLARDFAGLIDPAVRAVTDRGRPEPPQPPITRRIPGLAAVARTEGFDSSAQSLQDFYDEFDAYESGRQALKRYEAGEGRADVGKFRAELQARFSPEKETQLKEAKKAIDELRDDLSDVTGSRTMTPPQKAEERKAIYEAMVDIARRALGQTPLTRKRYAKRERLAGAGR